MSTTTQILFNSPALHSLKREQLVKLCKIHAIKANGKNVDIIQRLRSHAQTMPKDSPLSIAARSEPGGAVALQPPTDDQQTSEDEDEQRDVSYRGMPRPSEQWEVVMDSIAELEEGSSQGTLSSQRTFHNGGAGEFGTGSSRSTTVSSSIKALATSLGLKRSLSKATPASSTSSKNSLAPEVPHVHVHDELSQASTPYFALPPTTSQPLTHAHDSPPNPTRMSIDSTHAHLPGHSSRPGVPAPTNARLSLGLGLGAPSTPTRQGQPTTTIRLISNPFSSSDDNASLWAGENGTPQLKPFKTSFDLILGSPAPNNFGGFSFTNTWPPRNDEDDEMHGIYPRLTINDLPPSLAKDAMNTDEDRAMPGALTPAHGANLHLTTPQRNPSPFIFGSGQKVTNTEFKAAALSVLEEMNARLREEGVDPIQSSIIAKLHPQREREMGRDIKPMPGAKRADIGSDIREKFERMHESEFEKMEGIDGVLKRRAERSPPKKSLEGEKVVLGRKRKSSARESLAPRRPGALAGRASATRVISNGRRAKALPGSFGDEEDEDSEAEEAARAGKRVRVDPEFAAARSSASAEEEERQEEERKRLDAEKDAIRKKVEANRARRRSSAAHAHGGMSGRRSGRMSGRPSLLVKPKAKPSRFGFLSSAKTLVTSVWNRGKPAAQAAPSNIPKPTPTTTTTAPTTSSKAPPPTKEKWGQPALGPTKKSSIAPARPTSVIASGTRVPSIRINTAKKAEEDKLAAASLGKGSVASSSRSRSPIPSFGGSGGTPSTRNSLQSNAGTRGSRVSSLVADASRGSSLAGTGRTSSAGVSSVGMRVNVARASGAGVGGVGSMGAKKVGGGGASVASRSSVAGSATGSASSRLSRMSSRLFAPTASSLAKASGRPSTAGGAGAGSALRPVSESRQHTPAPATALPTAPVHTPKALGSLTNSPVKVGGGVTSPRPGGIFSKPLLLPQHQSGIPTPIKKPRTPSGESSTTGEGVARQRSLNGRKPRISRSKVIARLASQRAAGSSSTSTTTAAGASGALGPRTSGGRTRSSLGSKARASYGGGGGGGAKGRTSGGGGGVLAARKRARVSEYARRRSRVGGRMEVDGDGGL